MKLQVALNSSMIVPTTQVTKKYIPPINILQTNFVHYFSLQMKIKGKSAEYLLMPSSITNLKSEIGLKIIQVLIIAFTKLFSFLCSILYKYFPHFV